MRKRFIIAVLAAVIFSLMITSGSFAAEKKSFGAKVKNFWKNLIGYPARVTEESASVVADTGKKSVSIVTTEVKKVADVTSGEFDKTKDLVTEPITGTAETVAKAVEGTVKVPSEALKDKAAEATPNEKK